MRAWVMPSLQPAQEPHSLAAAARITYTGPMTVREEAHRLLDEVPESRLADAIGLLRQWVVDQKTERPLRRFRTTAIFDGEPDLSPRSKEIVREAWSAEEHPAT